jgi:hypothetical protein
MIETIKAAFSLSYVYFGREMALNYARLVRWIRRIRGGRVPGKAWPEEA